MTEQIPIVGTAGPRTRAPALQMGTLPTGIPSLDVQMEGGLRLGRIAEITGRHHSAKTTLSLQILGQAQRCGLVASYLCGTAPPPAVYLQVCGVDLDDLQCPTPEQIQDLEAMLNLALEGLRAGNRAIVIDALPAFPTRAERRANECEPGSRFDRAATVDCAYRLASAHLCAESSSILIVVNQLREQPGILFGNPQRSTVGDVTDHFPIRIRTTRIQAVKEGGRTVGHRFRADLVKNSGGPQFLAAEFELLHDRGLDYWGNLLDVALACGTVCRQQGRYFLDGEVPLGGDRAEAKAAIEEYGLDHLCQRLPESIAYLLREFTGG